MVWIKRLSIISCSFIGVQVSVTAGRMSSCCESQMILKDELKSVALEKSHVKFTFWTVISAWWFCGGGGGGWSFLSLGLGLELENIGVAWVQNAEILQFDPRRILLAILPLIRKKDSGLIKSESCDQKASLTKMHRARNWQLDLPESKRFLTLKRHQELHLHDSYFCRDSSWKQCPNEFAWYPTR